MTLSLPRTPVLRSCALALTRLYKPGSWVAAYVLHQQRKGFDGPKAFRLEAHITVGFIAADRDIRRVSAAGGV